MIFTKRFENHIIEYFFMFFHIQTTISNEPSHIQFTILCQHKDDVFSNVGSISWIFAQLASQSILIEYTFTQISDVPLFIQDGIKFLPLKSNLTSLTNQVEQRLLTIIISVLQ